MPSTTGSAIRLAKTVLKALTTRAADVRGHLGRVLGVSCADHDLVT